MIQDMLSGPIILQAFTGLQGFGMLHVSTTLSSPKDPVFMEAVRELSTQGSHESELCTAFGYSRMCCHALKGLPNSCHAMSCSARTEAWLHTLMQKHDVLQGLMMCSRALLEQM